MQIISKSYETADRFQTHPNALSTHTWPHIHFFQTFKSLYSQRTLPASDVKTRDLSLKTFCTNLGLPSSLPHTTTVRKDSVYQKKVYKSSKDLNTNGPFIHVTPTTNHRHFNLFLGSVGSFPGLVNEKLLHFHTVI